MRIKGLLGLAATLFALASPSFANCIGSENLKTCYDSSGNIYTVNKLGNTTNVTGSNPNGSNWNQSSSTYGNTTITNGQTNGRSWNETQTTAGSQRTVSGTNAQGQPYLYTCTKYGCN